MQGAAGSQTPDFDAERARELLRRAERFLEAAAADTRGALEHEDPMRLSGELRELERRLNGTELPRRVPRRRSA